MGAAELAEGSVGRDAQGRIKTYSVASGDVASAIGDRFCLGNGISLPSINRLKPLTSDPADIAAITQALDVGDLEVLREMFG